MSTSIENETRSANESCAAIRRDGNTRRHRALKHVFRDAVHRADRSTEDTARCKVVGGPHRSLLQLNDVRWGGEFIAFPPVPGEGMSILLGRDRWCTDYSLFAIRRIFLMRWSFITILFKSAGAPFAQTAAL